MEAARAAHRPCVYVAGPRREDSAAGGDRGHQLLSDGGDDCRGGRRWRALLPRTHDQAAEQWAAGKAPRSTLEVHATLVASCVAHMLLRRCCSPSAGSTSRSSSPSGRRASWRARPREAWTADASASESMHVARARRAARLDIGAGRAATHKTHGGRR